MTRFGRRHFARLAAGLCIVKERGLATPPAGDAYLNSIGLRLVRVQPGSFRMGQKDGDYDERPPHQVAIRRPFFIGATEITNAQYEQFDPSHRRYRGMSGVSRNDDEAVVFVSWRDAVAFCEWLSRKEGKTYRLPTEAEWEYTCRSGTTTSYSTGDSLPEVHHRNQPIEGDWQKLGPAADDDLRKRKGRVAISLQVGQTPANAWGIHEMHGGVEEWCQDWYGKYPDEPQTDPIGPADGWFKVCRGGSHNTYLPFLRSANRSAALPDDRHWLIGFRIVQGEAPRTTALSAERPTTDDASVIPKRIAWRQPIQKPLFREPIPFVRPDFSDSRFAGLNHHHNPSITWCENGDLLAAWYNTRSEIGREMVILSSRLRDGNDEWDTARLFLKAADRNMSGTCLFHDGRGGLFFFNGISESSHHRDQCMMLCTSVDSGRSWSRPRIVSNVDERRKHHPISSAFRAKNGDLVLAMDTNDLADVVGEVNITSGTVCVSHDKGRTWIDQSSDQRKLEVREGGAGKLIAGFHPSVVELNDGRLLAFSRTGDIGGHITKCLSNDFGRSWTYSATEFPGIGGGQRLVLMRLREGTLLMVSFTRPIGMSFTGSSGNNFTGYGMFAALSLDEGETWPVKKLLTAGGPARQVLGGGHEGMFLMDEYHAERAGYLAATQTPDGIIHLISSRWHYRFNLSWLMQPPERSSR